MLIVRIATINQLQHRSTQCLSPAQGVIAGNLVHGGSDKFDRRVAVDLPMRDEQRASLGVDEGPGKPRQCFGARCLTGCGVACRQDHQICQSALNRHPGSACKKGSDAISMISLMLL